MSTLSNKVRTSPFSLEDSYKLSHHKQYPAGTTVVYSNLTPRKGMRKDITSVTFFGLQAALLKINDKFDTDFFGISEKEAVNDFKKFYKRFLGTDDELLYERIRYVHKLGYLPIEVFALPEGVRVPYGVPVFTIQNTDPECFWLTNILETWLSAEIWKSITSATTARIFRKTFDEYAALTSDQDFMPPFQGHDFSMRGMSGVEDAMMSGAGHAIFFQGSDTCPVLEFVDRYYPNHPDDETLLVTSVPATEHSVVCASGNDKELLTRLLTETYPSGILSYVSDTWDLWSVVTKTLPALKDIIIARDGKLVIRPDCYAEDTQIFTEKGWVFFSELTEDTKVAQILDDGSYEMIFPTAYIDQPYTGPMHHVADMKGKIDLLITPNHRMILQQEGKERVVAVEKLKQQGNAFQKMTRSAPARSDTAKRLTDIERLKIAFQADGSHASNTPKSIAFSFSKQRKIDRLISLLKNLSFDYSVYDLKDGRTAFRVFVEEDLLPKNFGWVDTTQLTKEWCQDFIEELSYWDATRRSITRFKFDTTNEEVVKVVELIALSAGYGVLISCASDNRKDIFNDVFTAHILKDNSVGGQSWTNKVVPYSGRVYCVSVPTGKILVKRNRSTMVCGNSSPKTPYEIICGDVEADTGSPEWYGLARCLYNIFGGEVNSKGFIQLDSHIGMIYGEAISPDMQLRILKGLETLGFSSTNIVMGIGSYTYQYVTRDTHGLAMKATCIVKDGETIPIFKDPKTDTGSKKSAKGYLNVEMDESGEYYLKQECESPEGSELELVYLNGGLLQIQTFTEIRATAAGWGY